jgi:hypothetical protein
MANTTERKWGAKTTIGDAAAQESWNKNWLKNESKQATSDRVKQARDEADAEVKRETRGMAKGGMTASSRADGIAKRGKTRGRIC